jgi:hypothetical protein
VPDGRTGCGKERAGLFNPGHLLARFMGLRVVVRGQAFDLLHVKYGATLHDLCSFRLMARMNACP